MSNKDWAENQWFIVDYNTNIPLRHFITNDILHFDNAQEALKHYTYRIPQVYKSVVIYRTFKYLNVEYQEQFINQLK